MAEATKECKIENSVFNGDNWIVHASVVVGEGGLANRYCASHVVDGDENATEADLQVAVLALY